MSFLYPLLWLGALGAAVPLWLHLRRKQPRNVTRFSALRFLDDQPRPRRGGLRVRDPLLLALRLLALLLVVAAFTWPYVREAAPVVTASRVHILDATLSQRAGGGFEADRDAVLRALDASPASVQNAVVTLTHEPAVTVSFGDDRATALARLRALAPSHQRGSYLEAFRLAGSLLDRSLGLEREIVVHGDFQSNQWSEHQTSPPFLRGVEVTLAGEPGATALPNLALHEPRSRFSFVGDETFVDLTLDLVHQGPKGEAHVVVSAGGETVLEGDFGLEPPASSLTLRAHWRTDPSRWLSGHAEVAGAPDALAADDRAYFCIPPVREGRLALLARSPYLRAALAPDVMRGRWATEELDPAALRPEAPLAELADVLIAEASYAHSEKARELILRYLNNERGVVLLLDRATPLVKGFLRELGLEVVDADAGAGASQTFRYFNVFHPIFRPFADGGLGDLTTPRVHEHARLRSAVARPLIYGHVGGALMVEGVATKGRLLLFTFGFRLDQTDWPIQPSFVPFLDLTLQYARAATPLATSWTPGELYAVELPEDRAVAEVVVAREGGDGEPLRVAAGDTGVARFRVPDEPGIYRVSLDDDTEPHALLAVNPAPDESRLVYEAEPAALAAWTLPASEEPAPATSTAALTPLSDVLAQKLWWWLALAALLALAGESLHLGRREEAT